MLRCDLFAPRLPPFDQAIRVRRRAPALSEARRQAGHHRLPTPLRTRPGRRSPGEPWRPWDTPESSHRRTNLGRIAVGQDREQLARERLLRALREKMTALADRIRRLFRMRHQILQHFLASQVLRFGKRKSFYRYIQTFFRILATLLPLAIAAGHRRSPLAPIKTPSFIKSRNKTKPFLAFPRLTQ